MVSVLTDKGTFSRFCLFSLLIKASCGEQTPFAADVSWKQLIAIRFPMIERVSALAGAALRIAPAIVVGLVALTSEAAAARPEVGVWYDDSGQGAVEIYICQENASRLCGRIVWLKEPLNAEGVAKHDRNNPEAGNQNRPICGLPMLWGLGLMSDGSFDGGKIYDPKTGKTYSASIQMASGDSLTVTGYLGVKMLGKSFTWTRAPGNLPRCEGAPPPG